MALPLMIAQSVVFVAGTLLQRSLCPASTSSSSSRCCPSLILLHFITVLFSTCTLYSIPKLCKCVCRSASTLPLHRTPQRTARLHVTTKCPGGTKYFGYKPLSRRHDRYLQLHRMQLFQYRLNSQELYVNGKYLPKNWHTFWAKLDTK